MLKVAVTFKRKPGMGLEAFQDYWRTRHADVVCRLPGLRRYVQSHPLPAGYSKGELARDGVAELWFDDLAALKHLATTPEYRDLEEDEARFIDRDSIVLMLLNTQWSRGEARWLGPYGHHSVSSPRSSNRTCGFPASGFPTGFTSKHTAVGQDGPDFVGSHRAPRTRPYRGNLVPRDDTLWRLTRK